MRRIAMITGTVLLLSGVAYQNADAQEPITEKELIGKWDVINKDPFEWAPVMKQSITFLVTGSGEKVCQWKSAPTAVFYPYQEQLGNWVRKDDVHWFKGWGRWRLKGDRLEVLITGHNFEQFGTGYKDRIDTYEKYRVKRISIPGTDILAASFSPDSPKEKTGYYARCGAEPSPGRYGETAIQLLGHWQGELPGKETKLSIGLRLYLHPEKGLRYLMAMQDPKSKFPGTEGVYINTGSFSVKGDEIELNQEHVIHSPEARWYSSHKNEYFVQPADIAKGKVLVRKYLSRDRFKLVLPPDQREKGDMAWWELHLGTGKQLLVLKDIPKYANRHFMKQKKGKGGADE